MKFHRETDGRLVVSLTRGEPVRASLEQLALEQGLVAAQVSAIGALEDPELGCWDLEQKVYHKRLMPGVWELLSLQGNLSLHEEKPFLHAHVLLSGADYTALGGHFFESRVGVVLEMFVLPYPTPLPRRFCPELGLPRWEPGGN